MVKIGFICEGYSENIILSSKLFRQFLTDCNLELVSMPINAKGSGNLLPQNRIDFDKQLFDKGALKIFILTDLDTAASEEDISRKLKPGRNHILIVAKKMIESWFLSNDVRMLQLTNQIYKGDSELVDYPAIDLKRMLEKTRNHKKLNHRQLATIFIGKDTKLDGFDIQNSKCNSAKLFVQKLKELGAGTLETKVKPQKNKNK